MAKRSKGTTGDWIADRAMRGLIAAALALPYRWRVPAMGWIMAQLIAPLAGYRRRAMSHLAFAWPDMSLRDRRRLADAVSDNSGRTLIENYGTADLRARLADTVPTGPGLAALGQARAAGRTVIFVTAHYGNYEVPRHVLTARGYTIGGLYKRMRNPFFNAHYVRTMEGISGPVFEKGRRGTMGFARLLRGKTGAGGMATILFDIYDHHGPEVDFLGHPAPTSTSAADLALRFDALLVPYFGIRQPNGLDFEVLIDTPIPHGDPVDMTRAMTRALEARIAADPGQWFWVHRRWKPGLRDRRRSARTSSL